MVNHAGDILTSIMTDHIRWGQSVVDNGFGGNYCFLYFFLLKHGFLK